MKRYGILIGTAIVVAWLAGFVGGCSEKAPSQADTLTGYFPEKVDAVGLQRGAEIRTFVGDSLWQYIDGGAELYHTYGFVKVSTADYQSQDVELVLDLYQFKSSDGAYGLYSALRPDEPNTVALGVEGYSTTSSLEFVRGNVMARIIAYEASEAVSKAVSALAGQVAAALPGTTERPAMFTRLPQENAVKNTDKIVGASFLGQVYLNMVYTRDYQFENERATLFLIKDSLGAAFAEWTMAASDAEKAAGQATGLSYDENYCLLVANNYYGNVLAGLKNGKLGGMVNYTDRRHDFVAGWLNSLSK